MLQALMIGCVCVGGQEGSQTWIAGSIIFPNTNVTQYPCGIIVPKVTLMVGLLVPSAFSSAFIDSWGGGILGTEGILDRCADEDRCDITTNSFVIENIARIANAIPCHSLLKAHYEC